MNLKELITEVPDFPQKGISFKDISPLLKSSEALHYVAEEFRKHWDVEKIELIAGIESRGFILASYLAAKFGKGFLPIRKQGKLPPPVISERYSLEYGEAVIEVKEGKEKILIVDDVLATGGTLKAAIQICERAGYQVHGVGVLVNLTFLNEFRFAGQEVPSLVQY